MDLSVARPLVGPQDEQSALTLDAVPDPVLRRSEFAIPTIDGRPSAYLAGNSLGLQPRTAAEAVQEALASWAGFGVLGHGEGPHPWMPYHTETRGSAARIVGAREREAVMMNSLTVNLHLMLTTFYRPTPERFRLVIEHDAFPSDRYAIDSQARLHGFNPTDAVVELRPRDGEGHLRAEDVAQVLNNLGDSVALVLLGAVNYRTGALLDIPVITAAAHAVGAIAGWDLAHAAGNVPLELHDWDVDFAVWCSYKYLNSGPGSVGGCFVHERHGNDTTRVRPAGWWGHDPTTRFAMPAQFDPQPGAESWQLSNPPILSLAAVRASLSMFDDVGMPAIRRRSLALTGHLAGLLDQVSGNHPSMRVITPIDPSARGAQLTVEVPNAPAITEQLRGLGVIADERPPNLIRFAPAPLYNTFHDCWRAATALQEILDR